MAPYLVIAKSKFPATCNSECGQSTIEALAVSLALLAFISILGAVLYFSIVHVGMNYLLHEHLVCEETSGNDQCRKDFLKATTPFLIFAEINTFESQRRHQKISNRMVLRMPFGRILHFKSELRLYR